MKVYFKHINKFLDPKQIKGMKEFIKFLQNELQLNDDVYLTFTGNKDIKMTTGVRMPGSKIFALAKNRLLVDIFRTVAHEWVHEFQYQKLGLKDDVKIQDIGGPEENMANTLSGIFVKKFAKDNPHYSTELYEGNS
tara:strand:+ start:2797 stop:3204 length:408 start_codon:yes stop_codon:yes gene_type:complete